MNTLTENKIYKPLAPFYLASLSLLATGFLFNPHSSILEFLFFAWTCISGIYIVYTLNDFIDQTNGFTFSLKEFLTNKKRLFFVLQTIFIIAPTALYYFSFFRFKLLTISFLLGFLYSYQFNFTNFTLRLKHVFILKNVMIGLSWGTLVLIGSHEINEHSTLFFLFSSAQVFMGSVIRDISDFESDTRDHVNSMPVVLGIRPTLNFLNIANALIFIITLINFQFFKLSKYYLLSILIVSIWRAVVIERILNSQNIKWQQKWNLLTCLIIFLGALSVWLVVK